MTAALYALAKWCLSVLPADAAGRRVFDETLADWRREATNAKGTAANALVATRAMWSVARCVMMVSLREIRAREGAALLLRLVAWSVVCMLVFIGIRWNDSIVLQGARVTLGPVPGALLSVQAILTAMPFLAFLCAASGRRRRASVPRMGPAVVAGAAMFVAMGWVMPATNQAYREFILALWSNGVIPSGINERSIVELVEMLFTENGRRAAFGLNIRLVFVIATPVMLVIGATARTLTGWRRVTGSLLPILLLMSPALVGLNRYGEVAWWPALFAVILTSRDLVSNEDDIRVGRRT